MSPSKPRIVQRVCQSLSCALLLGLALPAAASSWTLDAVSWARPRTGAAILSMRPLPEVVDAWSRSDGGGIVIRHPGGENGEVWAAELRDWLVALGVPGASVHTIGGGEPEQLRLEVR